MDVLGVLLSSEATDAKPFLNVGNPEQIGKPLSEPLGRRQWVRFEALRS